MTDDVDPDEERIAAAVEELLSARGRDPGPRQRRNESRRGGLHVDYTYDSPAAGPAVALEITTLRDQAWERGKASLPDVADELTELAVAEELGRWSVEVHDDASLRALKPEIVTLLRAGREVSVDDGHPPEATRADHERWSRLGLMRLKRRPGPPGVRLAGWSGMTPIEGFEDLLAYEVDANAAKLQAARQGKRETHLAVEVRSFYCSREPSLTPAPALPEDVDVLWVFFRWHNDGRAGAWESRRGDAQWRLHLSPLDRG